MRTELLTVGAELLSGCTINTNAAELGRALAEAGFPCGRQTAVGDDRAELLAALRDALGRCGLLVVTGGLGPTFDDLTMAAIAEATSRPLRFHPATARAIRRFYARHGRALQEAALRQAWLPRGGTPLPNPLGTAPGLWLALPHPVVVALPGVPREMRRLFHRAVRPRLARLAGAVRAAALTIRTIGVVELSIQAILRRMRLPDTLDVGLYPHLRMVDVRLRASAGSQEASRRLLAAFARRLRARLGRAVYGAGEETLESVVGAALARRGLTLAVAESCTGGLVSDLLTNVPGSSRYVRGAIVAYHNALKRVGLRVPEKVLRRAGAVSAETARWMARGVRDCAGADVGLAITGIAGPGGGTKRKPVGLVYLGLSDGSRTRSRRCQFVGDRAAIKLQAAQTALDWLRRHLQH